MVNSDMETIKEYLIRIGSRGGKKRMAALTPNERSALARKAGKRSGKIRAAKALLRDASG